MKNLVIVTVEVKQVAAIAVIGEASSSKRQWSRCSRLRRRVAVAAMAWLCAVASVTVGSCFARLRLQSVGCCFTRLLFGVSPSPISELYVCGVSFWCECMLVERKLKGTQVEGRAYYMAIHNVLLMSLL
ncbi:hypothetical protein AB3S75_034914 [Citrus x aurantiifolia]